jgi:hypothetical protein
MEFKTGSGSSLVNMSPLNSSLNDAPIAIASALLFSICLPCLAERLYSLTEVSVAGSSTVAVFTTKALDAEECMEMNRAGFLLFARMILSST